MCLYCVDFIVYKNSEFGAGDGPIIYSNVMCRGFEASIFDCPKIDDGLFTCSHNNIAGIKCVDGMYVLIVLYWYLYNKQVVMMEI